MLYTVLAIGAAVLLFVGVVGALEIGRRLGARRKSAAGDVGSGTGAIDAAVFALLGLLIAFTFSGAALRFDDRRHLIVEETNDIGTAYLRIDLLSPAAQPALRDAFRKYVDARIAAYGKLPDAAAAQVELDRASVWQARIWRQAVAGVRDPDASPGAAILLVPALNAMFDITTTRAMATRMHPPTIVFGMLFGLAVAAALLAGYAAGGASSRPWLHALVFAAAMALAAYVILDLEFPRRGLIRVDDFDQALIALRATMN
jgi:hypothetical protein